MVNKITALLFVFCFMAFAAEFEDEGVFNITGHASYQGGHVLSGTYSNPDDINNYWYQKVFANIGFIKKSNDWLTITAAIEASLRPSYKSGNTFPESQVFIPHVYIDQAKGDIDFIKSDEMSLRLTTGYFHYQYNEDVTNLGNNLFKSYCYPTAIVQPEFDFAYSRLTGFNLHFKGLNGLVSNDLLFTSHINFYPTGDFSLTDIVGTEPIKGLKVALGLQFDRFIPIDTAITTPKNVAQKVNPETNDTIYYTYAGTKFMACVNLDLKKLIFGEEYPDYFGTEDLKLWGELNILGLKNYYYFYENLGERIPIAFGIKFPTFKFLDIFALEGEYFPSRYPNSIDRPLNANTPYPEIQEALYDPSDWDHDDWKWSLYLRKDISDMSIIFQIARDHLQLWSTRPVDQIFHDNLTQTRNKYYQLKIQYRF